MKILHIVTGLGNGGAEAVLVRLASKDSQKGNQHFVISLTDRGIYSEHLEKLGIAVEVLNFPRGSFTFSGVAKLLKIIKNINPHVVQTWMYHADLIGGVAARLLGIRSIVWGIRHANLDPAHNSKSTLLIVRLCARLSILIPKKIVTCSEEAMRLHKAVGYQADKFVQIPNGYSMDRLKPDVLSRNKVRAELNVMPNTFVLGMVARFDVQKDHRNLIGALAHIKNRGVQFVCLLVGVGMEESNDVLHNWIEDAGISDNVKLLGPRNDIPAVMNAMDVHVLSSLGEAFPNVLAEAMACGTPCVTTNVGDAAFIVAEHGWVVKPQDAMALADGLVKAHDQFFEDSVKWKDLQSACRLRIMDNFELELMCERYRAVWKACMQV